MYWKGQTTTASAEVIPRIASSLSNVLANKDNTKKDAISEPADVSDGTTTKSGSKTNHVLEKSDESHLVEDRALERLGRLLSASTSLFSNFKLDLNTNEKETKVVSQEIDGSANSNDDVISTSDTSSHLWQGIAGQGNNITSIIA